MGCNRDKILPSVFVDNIVKFQKATGATVDIVVYDERSNSILRNGLSYTGFVEALCRSLSQNYPKNISSSSDQTDEPISLSSTPST